MHNRLIIDLKGTTLLPEEKARLQHPYVGGIILFSRNFEGIEQVKSLISTIRGSRKEPLTIFVDQEGGEFNDLKLL